MNTSYTLTADALVAHVQSNGLALPLATPFTVTGPDAAPVIVVLGGISAHRHAADCSDTRGWWREQVGPGLALDTEHWRIVSLDWIGGPEAPLPMDAAQLVPGPALQAEAVAAALDRLQVPRAHAIIGASFGGQVALAFAARWPERVGRVITLCAAARSSARARAFRHLQREVLALGRSAGQPAAGVALARAIALLTYRTATELEQRFGGDPTTRAAPPMRVHANAPSDEATAARTTGLAASSTREVTAAPDRASMESWLAHHGERFAARFDNAHFAALSRALDEPALSPESSAHLAVPLFAFAVQEDELIPVADVRALTATAPQAELCLHSSLYGHDAFLKDSTAVRTFLEHALGTREVNS